MFNYYILLMNHKFICFFKNWSLKQSRFMKGTVSLFWQEGIGYQKRRGGMTQYDRLCKLLQASLSAASMELFSPG
jgi:hypothetical protein